MGWKSNYYLFKKRMTILRIRVNKMESRIVETIGTRQVTFPDCKRISPGNWNRLIPIRENRKIIPPIRNIAIPAIIRRRAIGSSDIFNPNELIG